MAEVKYLSLSGLQAYDALIKNYVDTADQQSIKKVTVSGDTVSFFKSLEEGATADFTVTVPVSDVAALKEAVGATGTGLTGRIEAIEAAVGEGGSVAAQIESAIEELDAEDTAVAHQFVTSVSEEDGVITVTRAALAADDIPELAIAKITGLQDALDAKQDTIVWESDNYDAETNKAITKSDLTAAVAGLTGATHFVGVKEVLPETANDGDIVIVGVKEYIWAESKWNELGDESIYAVKGDIVNADIADNAAIAQSKIAGLTDALGAKADAAYVGKASVKGEDGEVTEAATGLTAQVEANAAAIAVNAAGVKANADAIAALDIAGDIVEKIQALDANEEQTAGADGLALAIVEEDGVITSISGSIAANTYDAYGAASAVRGETEETVASVAAKVADIKAITTAEINKLFDEDAE